MIIPQGYIKIEYGDRIQVGDKRWSEFFDNWRPYTVDKVGEIFTKSHDFSIRRGERKPKVYVHGM